MNYTSNTHFRSTCNVTRFFFFLFSDDDIVNPILSPRVQRKQAEEARERIPMKLDAIFAPMRSESVDDMKTEIKIRGMGDIKLKPQVISKSSVDRNKLDEVHEQRRAARQQIAMPDKPAKFKRLKPKPKPKEPSPIKDPSPNNEEPQQVTPSKDLINDQHDEPEEIVEIVENIIQDENPEFLLEETEELSDEQINERLKTIYIYIQYSLA